MEDSRLLVLSTILGGALAAVYMETPGAEQSAALDREAVSATGQVVMPSGDTYVIDVRWLGDDL